MKAKVIDFKTRKVLYESEYKPKKPKNSPKGGPKRPVDDFTSQFEAIAQAIHQKAWNQNDWGE